MRWAEGTGGQRRKPQATVLITFSIGKCTLSDCESMRMYQFLSRTAGDRDWNGETDLIASQECFWDPTHNQSKEKHTINYQHPVDLDESHTHKHGLTVHEDDVKMNFPPPDHCALTRCDRVALLEERQLPSVKPTVTVCSCLMTVCRLCLSGGK